MNIKKITAVSLSLLMALSFAGCKPLPQETSSTAASSSSTSGKLEVEQGAKLTFRTGSANDVDFAKAAAENFQKKYGVQVTVEKGGLYDAQKAAIEGPSGKGPDVFVIPHDKMIETVSQGLLLEINDSIAEQLNEEINSTAMKTVTIDGKVYGVPLSIQTYVLFYNKKLVSKPITTFEELAEQAKTFNDPKNNKFIFLFDANTGSPEYTLISTYGYKVFGEDGTDEEHPGFDTPEFKKGLEVLQKYHEIVPIDPGDLGNTDFLNTQFIEGKTEYILSGPWDVKTFKEAGVDLGATTLPTYDGHQERSFGFVQNAVVSAYTKYPNAAQLFAQYLASQESAELLYSKAYGITARKDYKEVEGLSNDEILQVIASAFDDSIPMPSAKKISYFWTIMGDIGPSVFKGDMTADEAVAKAQEEWDSFNKTSK